MTIFMCVATRRKAPRRPPLTWSYEITSTATSLRSTPSAGFRDSVNKTRRQQTVTGARWSVTSFTSANAVRICPRCKTGAGPHKPDDKRWTKFISTCPKQRVVIAQVRTLPGRVFDPEGASLGRGGVDRRPPGQVLGERCERQAVGF